MTERVRVGVVGVGYWGRLHASKYVTFEGVELVGVVDIREERAQAVATLFGTKPYYHHQELLGKVDAVSVVTPTTTHYQIAKDFLEAGVDVLLEKPMASTLKEARELEELASRQGLILQIGHLERFNGAVADLDGRIDGLQRVEAYRLSPFTGRGMDVNVVLDLMIHDLDLLLHLAPLEVKRIEAEGQRRLGSGVDVARARIWTKGGWRVELVSSRVASRKVRKMVLHGAEGTLQLDFLRHRFSLQGRDGTTEGGSPKDSLREEISSFLQSVRRRQPPVVRASDGRRALELALMISDLIEGRCRDDGS